jgi:alkylation response protein AidB-like acyl-CoA dehydrogenase
VSVETETAAGPYADDVAAYGAALAAELARDPAYDRWRGTHFTTTEHRIAHHARLLAHLHAGDWNRYGWPVTAGGLGGDERHRAVLYDALSAADLPVPDPCLMLETLGPPVVRFAPHLAAAFLPAYLRGEQWWGQGFSEPEAGSDLASLRCRARRDGEQYVVNGQKIWMSHGATSTRLVCLVRTGTAESRHRGLSMIMIDADSPGVTVRPIAVASGGNELAEVFFDDVVVPADRLIGDEGQGWAVAMYLLQFERAQYAWLTAGVTLRELRGLRELLGRAELPGDAAARLGGAYVDLVALRARSAATVRSLAAGRPVGPEASVDKILLATAETRVHDLARDLLGRAFLVDADEQLEAARASWWYSRAATIFGGSAEVQRTIIADHVLKLPKESAR